MSQGGRILEKIKSQKTPPKRQSKQVIYRTSNSDGNMAELAKAHRYTIVYINYILNLHKQVLYILWQVFRHLLTTNMNFTNTRAEGSKQFVLVLEKLSQTVSTVKQQFWTCHDSVRLLLTIGVLRPRSKVVWLTWFYHFLQLFLLWDGHASRWLNSSLYGEENVWKWST